MQILHIARDIAAMEYCILCGNLLLLNRNNKYPICLCCEESISIISASRCKKCSKPLISEIELCMKCRERRFTFERNFSVFTYDSSIKTVILSYKFDGIKNISYFIFKIMLDTYKREYNGVAVVPIPSSRRKKKRYDWDHMGIVAELFKKSGIPVLDILRRKKTIAQKSLNFAMRQTNLSGMIRIIKKGINLPDRIVLLDDIFTTGATANECSKVLIANGVSRIFVLTFAID